MMVLIDIKRSLCIIGDGCGGNYFGADDNDNERQKNTFLVDAIVEIITANQPSMRLICFLVLRPTCSEI